MLFSSNYQRTVKCLELLPMKIHKTDTNAGTRWRSEAESSAVIRYMSE